MSFDPAATRRIGRRDVAVSLLGVGTAPFGSMAAGDTDVSIGAGFARLHGAGLRYFDTAPFYGLGLAEHRLGACLRTVDRRSVVHLDEGRSPDEARCRWRRAGLRQWRVAVRGRLRLQLRRHAALAGAQHAAARHQRARHRADPRRQPALAGRPRRAALPRGDGRRAPRAGRAARGRRHQGVRRRRQRLERSCCASPPMAISTASCSRGATRCSITPRSRRSCPIANGAASRS